MTPSADDPTATDPAAPAGVPEFLLPHLADIAKSEGLGPDYRIEYVPGAKPGDGYLSNMLSIALVGALRPAPDAEPTKDPAVAETEHRVALVCKLQLNEKESAVNSVIFEREVFVYNRLFPLLNRLQRGKGLTEANGGFYAVPKCYVAAMDVFGDESFIILEDLRPRGFVMWPKEKEVQFGHAKLLLEQLGRFHGLSLVLRDQRAEVFEDFENVPACQAHLIQQDSIKAMFNATFRRAERVLERPADKRLMQWLLAEWPQVMRQSLDGHKSGQWTVFGHSDIWNNNMLFRLNEDQPIEMSLLDWQFARPISPADDFIMFLCSTTEKPLRDAHYDEFLHIYHDSLAAIVSACGSDPAKLFSFEDFVGSLSSAGNYGVLEAALTISLMVADDEPAEPDADGEGEVGHLVQLNGRTKQLYRKRLEDMLEDARRHRWFTFDVTECGVE